MTNYFRSLPFSCVILIMHMFKNRTALLSAPDVQQLLMFHKPSCKSSYSLAYIKFRIIRTRDDTNTQTNLLNYEMA